MKTFVARFAVLALALTGFTASTIASTQASKADATPVCQPTCLPGHGVCGLD